MSYVERARNYAEDVLSGRILACKYVKLACKRHLNDLKRAEEADFPFFFDTKKAQKACRFIELLPHTKGKWAVGTPGKAGSNLIKLEDWQCFGVCSVFGWLRKSDGFRRFRVWYEEVPRKNAKSTKAAGVGLYCFAADGEFGAEVYSGATSEKQAYEVFRPAKLMAERTPDLLDHYGIDTHASNLHIVANGSRFEPVIGKPGDGAAPSCAIVDEYHEHMTDELYDTMKTGMGSREQPLLIVITTAGSDIAGPCYALRREVVKMLEGTVPNDELFGIIYTIDDTDNWQSEDALRKANPNFDVSVFADYLRTEQRDAINSARKQNVFKTKHLNVWVTARQPWMNMVEWNAAGSKPISIKDFLKQPMNVGLDLSSKIDLAAAARIFTRLIDRVEHYYLFSRFYLPESQLEDPDKAHFAGWANEGFITITPGNVIDYDFIRRDIEKDDAEFGIRQLGYDPYGATQLALELQAKGINVIEVPQRVAYLSEPMKWVEALVKAGRFHHDNNPVMNWCVSNVTAREDANENVFPRKERRENKIDGAVATIMATSCAMSAEPTRPMPRFRVVG